MSGAEAEHIETASAQLAGVKESFVEYSNVHVEPIGNKQSANLEYVNESRVYIESPGDVKDVSVMNWDVRKCLQRVGEDLCVLDKERQGCELGEMGSRMSNHSAAEQPGEGVSSSVNVVEEQLHVHGGESVTCETAQDGSRASICGNVETVDKGLCPIDTVGRQSCMDGGENCNGPVKDGSGGSDCNKGQTLGENPRKSENQATESVGEGNELLSCDITEQCEVSVGLTPIAGHESQVCETSVPESLIGLESVESESLDANVLLPDTVILEQGGKTLFPGDNVVECQLNSQKVSANKLSGCSLGGESGPQGGVGCVNMPNEPSEEKICIGLQNDSTANGDPIEDPSKISHGCLDDILDKPVQTNNLVSDFTLSERVANSSRFEEPSENLEGDIHGRVRSDQLEKKEESASEGTTDDTQKEPKALSDLDVIKSSTMDGVQTYVVEQVGNSGHGVPTNLVNIGQNQFAASDAKDRPNEQLEPPTQEITEKPCIMVLACPAIDASKLTSRGRRIGINLGTLTKKKDPRPSSVGTSRALRSRSRENSKAAGPSTDLENASGGTRERRGRKKKKEMKGKSHNEFSRMRIHLKYLLHRIHYEQNLLDAYSSEGWRGQSLEKLRPEKELERAKADINRTKLKIRDLFQRLDTLSTEGKFPDSLYDSEGLIDSEDIFCAKCGSKDLSPDNDIILCDGACERGFHQFCLDPPLRTEEIPPGDEGWLCPACDCKVDCTDLLNDSQGTRLSIEDGWEKVFPEAVAAMAGNQQDDIMGLPSDDSDDNDYNPDGIDDSDAKIEGSESSSDESDSEKSDSSDFSSASEDLGAVRGADQYLGLPSDDSEDDDYDPDSRNVNDDDEHESSSSDFTSASEDLGAAVDDGGTLGNNEQTPPMLEPDQDIGDSPPLSSRRHVERLDYKKLYDETYGNATSDSSDDEEWTDMKSGAERSGGSASADGTTAVGTSRRRGRPKRNLEAADNSPDELKKSTQNTCSGGKTGRKRQPYNRLGEAVTQRLYEAFKENHYPDRATKEKLAAELGLKPDQVTKWFGNARFSFNHHPPKNEATTSIPKDGDADNSSKLDTKGSGQSQSTPQNSRKRKDKEDIQPIVQSLSAETFTQTDSSSQVGRAQRRRRKSVA